MDKSLLNVSMNQIQVFFKVIETGGFSSAAMELFISQSAVSKTLSKLEQEIGIKLFERTTRTLKLTEEGRMLYCAWKPMVENMSQVYQQVKSLKKGTYLNVGLADTMQKEKYFLALQKQFEYHHQEIILFAETKSLNELQDKLQEGYYDLVMVPDFERYAYEGRELSWKWVKKSPAKVVLHKSHRHAGKQVIEMKDILAGEFLNLNARSRKPGNYEKDLSERFCKYNAVPRVRSPYAQNKVRRGLLESAHEMLFIDDYYIYGDDQNTSEVSVRDEYNGVICAWNRENQNAAVEKLLEMI